MSSASGDFEDDGKESGTEPVDVEKEFNVMGVGVSNGSSQVLSEQMSLWDQLMETRIKIQQVMKCANSIPTELPELRRVKGRSNCNTTIHDLVGSLEDFSTRLYAQLDGEISALSDDAFDVEKPGAVWERIVDHWFRKTQVASTLKQSGSENFSQLQESPVGYVHSLLNDMETLIRRTQRKRLGKNEDSEEGMDKEGEESAYNEMIFDDNDFYEAQLRDIIARRSNSSFGTTGGYSKQSLVLPAKVNKRVDRKASKGRRIRYNVMSKLVNFTGPSPTSDWTDEQKDHLFRSLFQ